MRFPMLITGLTVHPRVLDRAIVFTPNAADAPDRLHAGSDEVALADRGVPVIVLGIHRARVHGAVRDAERAALIRIVDPDVPLDQAVPDLHVLREDIQVAVD